MSLPPQPIDSALVDIVRDFLTAHGQLSRLAERQRAGVLTFDEVQALVGDGEGSVLYRLKERSHALFRDRPGRAHHPIGAEELFDLAVGSLFHEAMKFRENFYQRDSYGPKVRTLREQEVPDAAGLLPEFEKILAGTEERLAESLQEAEVLLGQTSDQFLVMLQAHASNGFATRFLLESGPLVEQVFGVSLEAVLERIHGSAAIAYAHAARSYLASGFFAQALDALGVAASRGEQVEQMQRLASYARGMQAYLDARYSDALDSLSEWIEASPAESEEPFARLALAAVSRVEQLMGEDASAEIGPRAAGVAERIRDCFEGAVRADEEAEGPLSRSAGS